MNLQQDQFRTDESGLATTLNYHFDVWSSDDLKLSRLRCSNFMIPCLGTVKLLKFEPTSRVLSRQAGIGVLRYAILSTRRALVYLVLGRFVDRHRLRHVTSPCERLSHR